MLPICERKFLKKYSRNSGWRSRIVDTILMSAAYTHTYVQLVCNMKIVYQQNIRTNLVMEWTVCTEVYISLQSIYRNIFYLYRCSIQTRRNFRQVKYAYWMDSCLLLRWSNEKKFIELVVSSMIAIWTGTRRDTGENICLF